MAKLSTHELARNLTAYLGDETGNAALEHGELMRLF